MRQAQLFVHGRSNNTTTEGNTNIMFHLLFTAMSSPGFGGEYSWSFGMRFATHRLHLGSGRRCA